jgi:hypothetical protein
MELTSGMGPASPANSGGRPSFPPRAKMKTCRIPALIDLAAVSCSGRLHQQTPLGDSFLKIAGSDGIFLVGRTRIFLGPFSFCGVLRSSASY